MQTISSINILANHVRHSNRNRKLVRTTNQTSSADLDSRFPSSHPTVKKVTEKGDKTRSRNESFETIQINITNHTPNQSIIRHRSHNIDDIESQPTLQKKKTETQVLPKLKPRVEKNFQVLVKPNTSNIQIKEHEYEEEIKIEDSELQAEKLDRVKSRPNKEHLFDFTDPSFIIYLIS